jgi:hypothetical protein
MGESRQPVTCLQPVALMKRGCCCYLQIKEAVHTMPRAPLPPVSPNKTTRVQQVGVTRGFGWVS